MSVNAQNHVNILWRYNKVPFLAIVHLFSFVVVLDPSQNKITSFSDYVGVAINIFVLRRCHVKGKSDPVIAEVVYSSRFNPDTLI